MISYKRALNILKYHKINIKTEIILSKDSVNRVASKNIYSPSNYPAANNSAFDGFAVNSLETENINKKKTRKFKIIKTLAAGDNPKIKNIKKFSTVEVMTGALICKPFNTIIPIEKISFFPNKKKPKYIIVNKKIKKYEYFRFLGSDYKKGKIIIKKGQLIQPNHILAFKSLGIEKVYVKKIPKIIFYTTGDEISNKKKIPNWKVRNSNSFFLESYLKKFPVSFKEKKF